MFINTIFCARFIFLYQLHRDKNQEIISTNITTWHKKMHICMQADWSVLHMYRTNTWRPNVLSPSTNERERNDTLWTPGLVSYFKQTFIFPEINIPCHPLSSIALHTVASLHLWSQWCIIATHRNVSSATWPDVAWWWGSYSLHPP